jgi:abhydrolase domain-containing protein 1/3
MSTIVSIKYNVFIFSYSEVLILPDGGKLCLDWENREKATEKCIMLIIPGLTSTSEVNFCTHYIDVARQNNCIAAVMNYRGTFLDLTTPRLYCATDQEDLDFVLEHIKKIYPDHSVFAVAISIGIVHVL